ncbi:DUF11 domain-containing protein [Myroides marinus]|uniref:DUF11 domain-containing protein n=1 Tax=Myroides marinus TaxID=703342 RepID=UPI0025773CCC|nr:DUF11 domain-containing protein [Myroides marinus]MDM1346626.1 DUF11 domain-containing protein [Myroides marinus]MDM1350031.1 DUF11 domain-containing protein [Myroides marinus]MDM1357238.1 DUF11 domain-containing protein [Myroides marinus]MDM1364684.1 DUF11 domain-containing protein [Myroides marinus]
MKQKTTFSLWKRLLLLLVLFVPLVQSLGQTKVYATSEKHGLREAPMILIGKFEYKDVRHSSIAEVQHASYVVDKDVNTKATLVSKTASLLGIGSTGESWLQMTFNDELEAGTLSFIEIGVPRNVGAKIDLVGLLNGVLGLFESNLIVIEATNKGVKIDDNLVKSSVTEGANGEMYLAITSQKEYDSLTIRLRSGSSALGIELGAGLELDVYNAYYYTENASCGKPVSTGVESSGFSINLLGGLYGKREFAKSIDNDENTYSTLKQDALVTVGVAGTLSQNFYFANSSPIKSSVNIKIGSGSGLLKLDLLGGSEVVFYNKGQEVNKSPLKSGVLNDTDLLGLLGNGINTTTLTFAPGVEFDQVAVRLGGLLNVGLLNGGLNIYDVERFDGVSCKNPLIKIPDATKQPFEMSDCAIDLVGTAENVDFAYNTIDGNNETYATLYASTGPLLGINGYGGRIEMSYKDVVKANQTSYIRIDSDKEVLDALLSGSLGKLVNGIGGLLLGNHYFEVTAKNAQGQSVLTGLSNDLFSGTASKGDIRIVQDNIGRYYIAITPNSDYKSIEVKNHTFGLLASDVRMLKVYNLCREIGTDVCAPAQFTSFDATGLSLGLSTLAEAGVKNPYHAISANKAIYSEINGGLVNVGGKVTQKIYFPHVEGIGGELQIKMFLNPGAVVDVELLGHYEIKTFNGNELQETFPIKSGIINNLDVLGLFKKGSAYTFKFPTTKAYNRVEISAASLVKVGTTPALRVYNVNRVTSNCPEVKTPNPFIEPVCATTILSHVNTDDVSNLIDGNIDTYATLYSDAGYLLGLGKEANGAVELGYDKVVKAGTTSYIRFDMDQAILDKLIGGSLGNVVTGLLNGLVLGNHYFTVEVKDASSNIVLKGSSKGHENTFIKNGDIRIVSDKYGRTYIAITPTVDYQSIRITDNTNSVLGILAQPNTMNVYGMCYESSTDTCVPSFATSYEFNGLELTIKDLSGAGVLYPERAIDDNSTNYSEISSGTLKIAGAVRQYIYFNSDVKAGEETLIKFKTEGGQVSIELIGAIEIKAYKGEKEVDALSSTNGLINGINVLDLLTTGQMVELPFKPKAAYDRISVGLKELVGISVGTNLHLYDVVRVCKTVNPNQSLVAWKSYKVNNDATINTVKGGEVVDYTIHVRNEGTETLTSLIVKDKLPAGVTLQGSPIGATIVNNELVYTYNGALAPGEVTTFNFTVDVNADLSGIVEIKNIAYVGETGQEVGKELFYPSYPPVNNELPNQPKTTANPGTVIKVVSDTILDKPTIIAVDDKGVEITDNTICAGASITLKVKEEGNTYQWYFNGSAISNSSEGSSENTNSNHGIERTLKTENPGDYTVVITKGNAVSKVSDIYTVVQKEAATLEIEGSQRVTVKLDAITGKAVLNLPNVTTNGSVPVWYNSENKQVQGNIVEFTAAGNYTLTVYSELNGCESYESLLVTVFDNSLCPPTTQRVYAKGGVTPEGDNMDTTWYTTLGGFVANKTNAVDGNPTTHSTISTTIALLGLGTTWQNIYFDHPVKAGTPVTIKLGKEYSGLVVAGGMSVVGLTKDGKRIGTIKPVAGGLLDLLTGDNVYEFTFVPSNKKGPQEYYGVQISLGALVGVAQLAKVYDVYYEKSVPAFENGYCEPVSPGVHPSVQDVLHGVKDLGLGVASATASVVNPWQAVDDDLETYATISRVVSVANQAHMTVVFKQQAMPGDDLHLVIGTPSNPVLGLELIKAFRIQRYLGDKKVGPEIDGTNGVQVIDLKLLGLGYKRKFKIIVKETDEAFDRVKITYTDGVAVLGEFTRIYEVSIAPKIDLGSGFDINEDIKEICEQGNLSITASDVCTSYKMFTVSTGGTEIQGSDEVITDENNIPVNKITFRLPKVLEEVEEANEDGTPSGVKYKVVYIQTYRNGCLVGRRIPVMLNTKNCTVKSNLNITHKIK